MRSDDEEAAASVSMILTMHAFDCGESELTKEAEDEMDRAAPPLLPALVRNVNAWTKTRQLEGVDSPEGGSRVSDTPPFGPKVRRNNPCPSGSERKYKRCCGAN